MTRLLILAALLFAPALASAQINVSIAGLSSLQVDGIAPGNTCADTVSGTMTCTYGGFYFQATPLLGTATRECQCYPGNTGPTGATGATGAAGSSGATGATGPAGAASGGFYRDSSGEQVIGLYRVDSVPNYWDGDVWWQVSSSTGLATPDDIGQALRYTGATCSGSVFGSDFGGNRTYQYRTKMGTLEIWGPVGSFSYAGTCYGWNGSSCTAISCLSGPLVELAHFTSPPDLSSYDLPLTFVGE